MNDLKMVLWMLTPQHLPQQPGHVQALDVDLANPPGLVEHLADGWEPVSHTITPLGWPSGCLLLTLFLKRPVQAPADVGDLTPQPKESP